MPVTHRTLGDKIRQARLGAGMTQTHLARAVQTSDRNIVRWETNRNAPRMEHLVAIAKATGVSLASLLEGDDDDEESSQVSPLTRDEYAMLGELMARVIVASPTAREAVSR